MNNINLDIITTKGYNGKDFCYLVIYVKNKITQVDINGSGCFKGGGSWKKRC